MSNALSTLKLKNPLSQSHLDLAKPSRNYGTETQTPLLKIMRSVNVRLLAHHRTRFLLSIKKFTARKSVHLRNAPNKKWCPWKRTG